MRRQVPACGLLPLDHVRTHTLRRIVVAGLLACLGGCVSFDVGRFPVVSTRPVTAADLERPANLETTALGAAFHAGLATGVWSGLDELSRTWCAADRFVPKMEGDLRRTLLAGWAKAVARTLSQP